MVSVKPVVNEWAPNPGESQHHPGSWSRPNHGEEPRTERQRQTRSTSSIQAFFDCNQVVLTCYLNDNQPAVCMEKQTSPVVQINPVASHLGVSEL